MEFTNRNLYPAKVTYYYEVEEYLAVFPPTSETESFYHTEEFRDDDLRIARARAIIWYLKRQNGIEARGQFFGKKLAAPGQLQGDGKDAVYSITLNFVIDEGPEFGENRLPIMGDDEETMAESLKSELLVLAELYGE